ncbi:S4 domain-containing protein [Alphaproteobacteria bacterium]|nr:S4 domain-containing protein [Alphaproteobacteria bacterium]
MSDSYQSTLNFVVSETYEKARLDKFLAHVAKDFSRSRLQALIKEGHVRLNDEVCTQSSVKLGAGDVIGVFVPEPRSADPEAENIPLDVVYEDEHLLVLNKAAGMVVHPGAGNHDGTLVNALLHHCGFTPGYCASVG